MSVPDEEKRAEDPNDVDESLMDDVIVDGRMVVGRTTDRDETDPVESPEHDAEVQAEARGEKR